MKHSRKKSRQSLFARKQDGAKRSPLSKGRAGLARPLCAAEPAPTDYLQASEYLNTDLIEVVELPENGAETTDQASLP